MLLKFEFKFVPVDVDKRKFKSLLQKFENLKFDLQTSEFIQMEQNK